MTPDVYKIIGINRGFAICRTSRKGDCISNVLVDVSNGRGGLYATQRAALSALKAYVRKLKARGARGNEILISREADIRRSVNG